MPETPTIDLQQLDFTNFVADKTQIYALLKQAGRFALLDAIVRFSTTDEHVSVGFKDIRADDWWCADHVPGRPLFPGVLMIETGAQLASWDHLTRYPAQNKFIGFGGLNETRFRGLVEPGQRLVFVAREMRVRSRAFTYAVNAYVGTDLVFETEVIGVVV